jgi:hypothetical protein
MDREKIMFIELHAPYINIYRSRSPKSVSKWRKSEVNYVC